MGTWDAGILDNDTALDGLGELDRGVVEDIVRFGAARPSPTSTAKLVAAIGVLLQLSAYDFGLDTDGGEAIVAAVERHGAQIAKLPRAARKVLAQVLAGEGSTLAERPAKMSARAIASLHAHSSQAPFGKREPSLLASPAGAAYVQVVARRCVAMIDGDFGDPAALSDLCREGTGVGCIGALMVLEPCRVPAAKVRRWRRAAKAGLSEITAQDDDELSFMRGYYRALDTALAILERRFGRDG
jgi:hypothetical protein